MQDENYDFLRTTERGYGDWIARIPLQRIVRGVPLGELWNEDWDFEILDEVPQRRPG